MEDVLRRLSEGKLTVQEALEELEKRTYGALDHNIDTGRMARTGVPEVVIAEGKTSDQLLAISLDFLERSDRAIVSRIEPTVSSELVGMVERKVKGVIGSYDSCARFLTLKGPKFTPPPVGGKVGILAAGTSDIPVSLEAELTANEMGCLTKAFYDVGVAGVHRLFGPLKTLNDWGADVIIVSAGREGALPTLVSGLVGIPVIGLPVSTGYGLHGKGETALFAMLQSCSPLSVVNIDAGFVAGAVAGRIANMVAGRCKG